MIGNLLTRGPDLQPKKYPHKPPRPSRPQRRPQRPPPRRPPNRPRPSNYRVSANSPRPPRRSPPYLKLPVVQDNTGYPYPPQPNGATFSFEPKERPKKQTNSLTQTYKNLQGGFLPSPPYWKTYDNLFKPVNQPSTNNQASNPNTFTSFSNPNSFTSNSNPTFTSYASNSNPSFTSYASNSNPSFNSFTSNANPNQNYINNNGIDDSFANIPSAAASSNTYNPYTKTAYQAPGKLRAPEVTTQNPNNPFLTSSSTFSSIERDPSLRLTTSSSSSQVSFPNSLGQGLPQLPQNQAQLPQNQVQLPQNQVQSPQNEAQQPQSQQDEATNFNPLNFNSQLNVASILSHLDDEDIEAIEAELTDAEISNLSPSLQEWYKTLEKANNDVEKSQSISAFKRQVDHYLSSPPKNTKKFQFPKTNPIQFNVNQYQRGHSASKYPQNRASNYPQNNAPPSPVNKGVVKPNHFQLMVNNNQPQVAPSSLNHQSKTKNFQNNVYGQSQYLTPEARSDPVESATRGFAFQNSILNPRAVSSIPQNNAVYYRKARTAFNDKEQKQQQRDSRTASNQSENSFSRYINDIPIRQWQWPDYVND